MTITTIPALLTELGNSGALAAVRELKRHGIKVWTMSADDCAPASTMRCSEQLWRPEKQLDDQDQVNRLIDFGLSHTGAVLYPTSIDLAWTLSIHRAILENSYRMYSPTAIVIHNVLDKRRLFEACHAVGIEYPNTCFAESISQVVDATTCIAFPLMLKRRVSVLASDQHKRVIVKEPAQLLAAYGRFVAGSRHSQAVRERLPFASWPLIQQYLPDAHNRIYLVSGFVNRDHTDIVAMAATKFLPDALRLSTGSCMKYATLESSLKNKILALCKKTGYFGVFQLEFMLKDDRPLLIDFNPCYYHYMTFDVARGLSLPWFVHMGACGDEATLASEIKTANSYMEGKAISVSSLNLNQSHICG